MSGLRLEIRDHKIVDTGDFQRINSLLYWMLNAIDQRIDMMKVFAEMERQGLSYPICVETCATELEYKHVFSLGVVFRYDSEKHWGKANRLANTSLGTGIKDEFLQKIRDCESYEEFASEMTANDGRGRKNTGFINHITRRIKQGEEDLNTCHKA